MAEPEAPATEQVTAPKPATQPAKSPKRVAAGKATALKTKESRERQKRDSEELALIKSAASQPPAQAPALAPATIPQPEASLPPSQTDDKKKVFLPPHNGSA